jgi:CheY-like chemotaxis protein
MEPIRVLIVEDHNVVRQGLAALLNVVDGLTVVGEAADGLDAIDAFHKHQPDVTLIDLRMPRMGGVEVIQRIRSETPQARFIVLTTYDGDEDIYRALKAGARAYLLKGMTREDLVTTIRAVHAGRAHGHRGIDSAGVRCFERDCEWKEQQGDCFRVECFRGDGEDPHQQFAGQAGRDGPDPGGDGGHPARSCSSRVFEKGQIMRMRGAVLCASIVALLAFQAPAQRTAWRQATAAELASVLPSRAPVENEHIETEMRTASGIVDERGHFIAGVVLITAGYSADGKYSHYLIVQAPVRIGDILLKRGEYAFGWTRAETGETLSVHFNVAATGALVGTTDAHRIKDPTRLESLHIWPPEEKAMIQIGRFGIPYKLGSD